MTTKDDPLIGYATGRKGGSYITGTTPWTGRAFCIRAMEDTTFTTLTSPNITGTLTTITLDKGEYLEGTFTAITLATGAVIAYHEPSYP